MHTMTHSLVRFVEDGIYHVCPNAHVWKNIDEIGMVSAKFRGIFYRAVFIAEGEKSAMETLKERCILSDQLSKKYKFPSPATPPTQHEISKITNQEKVKRQLFLPSSSGTISSLEIQQIVNEKPTTQEPGDNEGNSLEIHQHKSQQEEDHYDAKTTEPECGFPENVPGIQQHESETPKAQEPGEYENILEEQYHESQQEEDHNDASTTQPDSGFIGHEALTEDHIICTSSEEQSDLEDEVICGQEVIVETENKTGSKEKKKYYCPYCRKMYIKFARHLFQVHSEEPEMSDIADLKPKDPERVRVIAYLRARGAKIFNKQLKSPRKYLVTRIKSKLLTEQYMDCYLCGAKYKTKFLYRHIKHCPLGDGSSNQAKRRAMKAKYSVQEETREAIKFNEDVLSGLRDDIIRQEIRNDDVLQEYGKYLCSLYSKDIHLINLIRRKLREVAQILIEMKRLDNDILSMRDVFQPKTKRTFFIAVKNITCYNKGHFKKPSMARNLFALFNKCAERLSNMVVEEGNDIARIKVKRWIEVVKNDYNALISKVAGRTLDEKKWNRPRALPLAEDIFKLNSTIENFANESVYSLKSEFDLQTWTKLVKATIVKFVVFNRKRVGDIQRMRIDDFNKRHNIQKDSVTYEVLSESEKLISSKYVRMESRGKHARPIAILMTQAMVNQIETIIIFRRDAGVPEENPYVFGRIDNVKTFFVSSVLKELAFEVGAKNPELITGTRLRKQIATASQAFNFNQNDLSILAGFLGHNLQTHSQFYRLPDEAMQLAKISKVLEVIDNGKVGELKGKSLDELDSYVTSLVQGVREDDEEADQPTQSTELETGVRTTSDVETRKSHVKKRKRISAPKLPWTTPEKRAMRIHFRENLKSHTLPTPLQCDQVKSANTPLKRRTVAQMKAWVWNQNCKARKEGKEGKEKKSRKNK